MKTPPLDSQVNKRQVTLRVRVVREGETDPPETRVCALEECRAVFLPYHSRQRFHTPKCHQRDEAKRRREWHRIYNLEWRGRVKEERPELHAKYAAHDAKRKRAGRYANGATPRPDRYRYA